jgi:UDP-4-amino-4-deoxy-L-arabinose formyltransferase/UDP-glucuronic acid dehydrogenase (UDP-4-keto-hexauronic acid decarboxylating)
MKAVVFAYHNMGITGLEALKNAGFAIQAIFTHEDNPAENCWFSSVANWGTKNGIQVFSPENINHPDWTAMISDLGPDTIFSFYYRYLLNDDILRIPNAGAYNLHGSFLPAYRGRAPVNWVIVNGEKETGVTLHRMVARADAGDIVGQRRVAIAFEDTAHTLFQKLQDAASLLLKELLPLIKEGRAPRIVQDLSKGSYFGRRCPEDGRIDWRWPSLRIYNLIRGVTEPYPGAFAHMPDGGKVIVWWAIPEEIPDEDANCGTVRIMQDRVLVKAADGWLRLIDIELDGKRIKDKQIAVYLSTGAILK